jgi:hypothetical protein
MALKVGNGTVNSVLKLEKKNGFIVFYFKKYIFKKIIYYLFFYIVLLP